MATHRSLVHGQHLCAAADLPPFAGARWAVFGMGATGRAVASLLSAHGAQLTLIDANPQLEDALRALFPGAALRLGPVDEHAFASCEIAFVSQGVPPQLPVFAALLRLGVKLIGEVELLAAFAPRARIAAVTGTNGKSTTTALLGDIVRAKRPEAFVGGNLGEPLSSWLLQGAQSELCVLELSSALIDGLVSVQPHVAVVLNVTPDHLERYGSLESYVEAKARLVQAVAPGGVAVLNADDPHVVAMAPRCRGRVWWFGRRGALPGDGLLWREDDTVQGIGGLAERWPRQPMAHARLLGRHNRDNAMAALLAADALLGAHAPPIDEVWRVYQKFCGLPHRLQLVGTYRGARWLNDSKATNDASAATALRAVAGPRIALLGGYDKGGGYAEVIGALQERPAKAVLVFGGAKEIIGRALMQAGIAFESHVSLALACERAEALVAVGDAVLLSPACSSFDAFANYVHRGDWFAEWVQSREARGDPIA